jgi:hypothetical protein
VPQHSFNTDAHNGLSQLDSVFTQVRAEATSGRKVRVTIEKDSGRTTIVLEPLSSPPKPGETHAKPDVANLVLEQGKV